MLLAKDSKEVLTVETEKGDTKKEVLECVENGYHRGKHIAKATGYSEKTVSKRLQELKEEGEVIMRQEGRKNIYSVPGERKKCTSSPFDDAPKEEVDKALDCIEEAWELIQEKNTVNERIKEKGIGMGEDHTQSVVEYLDAKCNEIFTYVTGHFFDLSENYCNVLYNDEVRKRFFDLLDRTKSPMLLNTLHVLHRHALKKKEDSKVASEGRKRLDLFKNRCLAEKFPNALGWLDALRQFDLEEAKETFIEMIEGKKHEDQLDRLVDMAHFLYHDDWPELIDRLDERLDELERKTDDWETEERIKKFEERFEESLPSNV